LPAILPTGQRAARLTAQQQRGIWLHALLQHLTEGAMDRTELQQRFAIPAAEIEPLWQQAQGLLSAPQLARFFDPAQHRAAYNEMPYVDAQGELKRIDRLVEFDDEVWVLDYKLGDSEDAARYRAQMEEYRAAMRAVFAGKTVRCALVFADGVLCELPS
jgi:ATP-dependent helicase/nuclease subunit A